MSGILPGVGVPHRRRINYRVNSAHDDSYFIGERSDDSSMDLTETALRARQRLEKKLSSCLCISYSRSNSQMRKSLKGNEEKKSQKSLKCMSINKVDGSERKFCSCC